MSTRSLLAITIISISALTGCKTVYSSVYTNKKNSFKPPVVAAKAEFKAPSAIDALATPQPGGLPPAMGGDQNAIPGIPGLGAPAAPAAGAPAIPGL